MFIFVHKKKRKEKRKKGKEEIVGEREKTRIASVK